MRSSDQRRLLAAEAARVVVESGDDDTARALRKAARRLGIRDRAAWPDADEVAEAVAERQRLFRPEAQNRALQSLRESALEAMRFFTGFHPRLCGPVLEGTADVHSDVVLHLHADEPEAVLRFMHEQRIPVDTATRRIRLADDTVIDAPALGFKADDVPYLLVVLPMGCIRQGPAAGDGKALRRADLEQVRRLAADLPATR